MQKSSQKNLFRKELKIMGKIINKVGAFAMSSAMLMSTAIPAMAANGTYDITINNPDKAAHVYEVYQIFTGDLSTTDNQLSNIKWGNGVTGHNAGDDATTDAEALTTTAQAETFAAGLALNAANKLTPERAADGTSYSLTGLAPGYYLIKDNTTTQVQGESFTKYMVKVVEDLTGANAITPKVTKAPVSSKWIKETNDTTGTVSDYDKKIADYDAGDVVPYELRATLPQNMKSYFPTTYQLNFIDTMTNLTFNDDNTFRVIVKHAGGGADSVVKTGFTKSFEGGVLRVNIPNVYALTDASDQAITVNDGDSIYVDYTATLSATPTIGNTTGNPNDMYVEYSNDPNNAESKGTTTRDYNVVMTYQVTINKVDENNQALPQAGFTLYKKYSALPTGAENKPKASAGEGDFTTIDNNVYKVIKVYAASEATSFAFSGIDAGEYRLEESVTPNGYNTMAPVNFTLASNPTLTVSGGTATANAQTTLSGLTATSSAAESGVYAANIQNRPGKILPETGGVGTRMFYLAGATLVISSAVVLVAKKRQENT